VKGKIGKSPDPNAADFPLSPQQVAGASFGTEAMRQHRSQLPIIAAFSLPSW
jgi:hypothetical protein